MGSNKQPLTKYLLSIITGIFLLLGSASITASQWQPSNYEKRFIKSDNGLYLKDNNVWVYSSEFAQRFGMPKQWIDDSLQGAEAVAYRVERSSLQKCGYFSDPNNCRPIEDCVLDVYLTDADSMKLPWKNNKMQDFIRYSSSTRFLTAQGREDASNWDPIEKRWDIRRSNIGLDSIGWVSGPPKGNKVYSESSGGVSVLAYDREVENGLDLIQLSVDCGIAIETYHVRIFFEEKFPTPIDYGYRRVGKALKASPEKKDRFRRIEKAWYEARAKGNVPHVVALPDTYMARVNEYDRKEYAPNSLGTEVEKRLRRDKSSAEEKSWWQQLFGAEE